MTSFADIVNEVHLNLLGYVSDQEQISPVTADFTATDTLFHVVDASQVSAGLIEVDEELMWCVQIDPDANVVYVQNRGMFGSTAVDHSAGSFVRNNPTFPRFAIMRAINQTITGSYPDLFSVSSTTIVTNSVLISYPLPTEVEALIDVTYQVVGPSGYWQPLRRYDIDPLADPDTYPTGVVLQVFEPVVPGRGLKVTYRTKPATMTSLADDFTAVTGLQESARECIVYGACAKMVGYLQPASMFASAAETRLLENANRLASGATYMDVGRYFYTFYVQAKTEENLRLEDKYPARPHMTR